MTCAFLLQEIIYELSQLNIFNLEIEKRQYLPHHGSDKGFKGVIVNQTLSYLCGGSFENSLIVPLSIQFLEKKI